MTAGSTAEAPARGVRIARLAAVHVALVAACFAQGPGLTSADTKLDLVVDPVRFLGRALTLWEPEGAFGQLQNQAYGYLFPMGPFFALGQAAGLPAWVVQRLWWALLLVLAFDGTVVLAHRLGVGTDGSRIVAGLAFALSPRAVTELTGISAELWPTALAPWVLAPLVGVAAGRERRAAARSAVAVALCGGVNAVAVGAVLPLPVLWLLGVPRPARRRRLAAWWVGCVLAACAWWLLPLLLLGRYSPPFLDWIESSSVTTSVATPANALRGVTHWVPYLGSDVWPAGAALVSSAALLMLLWLPVLLGCAALLMRSLPHRRFLVTAVLTGVALLTLGHLGPAMPPWAGAVRTLLDGAGAPLRNTHKFDVVVRLPLALALAHAVARLRMPAVARAPWTRSSVRVLAVCGVVATATPLLAGAALSASPFVRVPSYWYEAAAWLGAHDDGGRTLVVPGAPFAASVWGDPRDEPLQALASSPWAARTVVPLSSAGNIRLLTAVEQQLATGRGSPGLAEYLRRAGVSRLLVRTDLAGVPTAVPRPATVVSALDGSPGLTPVASFGPISGGRFFGDAVVDSGLDVVAPALQVWDVDSADAADPAAADPAAGGRATLWDAASAVRVAGGPEDLLTLADQGTTNGRPVVLDGDPDAGPLARAPLVATDGPQRREATFSSVRDVYSAPLTQDEPWRQDRAAHDWQPFSQQQVVADYQGVAGVRASSESDAASAAWAAFDGDTGTAWASNPFTEGPAWLRIDLEGSVNPPAALSVVPGYGARLPAVDVVTERGRRRSPLDPPDAAGTPQPVSVPPGPTRWIRLEFPEVAPAVVALPVVLREVALPGIAVSRPLRLPQTSADAGTVVLHAPRDGSDGCVYLGGRPLCSPSLVAPGEDPTIDRLVPVEATGTYAVTGTVRPAAGSSLDPALRPLGDALVASASSRRSGEPAERPQAAVDRDPGTAWVAAAGDSTPSLTLTWRATRTVSSLQFQTDAALAVSRAVRIAVSSGTVTRVASVGADGWARFAPLTGRRLRIAVLALDVRRSADPVHGLVDLPFGVSELVVPSLDDLRRGPDPGAASGAACGLGPTVEVGGVTVPTAVRGTVGDLLRRRPMTLVPCGPTTVRLAAGEVRVRLAPGAGWQPVELQLERAALPPTAPGEVLTPATWTPDRRVLTVEPSSRDRVLVVHENANPGWSAHLAGRRLTSVRLDGWQQGWIVPAGTGGPIVLTFDPAGPYRAGLLAGAVLLLALAALALAPALRKAAPAPAPGGPVPVSRPVPLPAGRLRRWGPAAVGTAALVLAGGPLAVLLLGGLLLLGHRALRRGSGPEAVLRPAAALGAAVAVLAGHWTGARGSDGWGALSTIGVWCLLAALAAATLLPPRSGPDPAPLLQPADDTAQPVLGGALDDVPRARGGEPREERHEEQDRHEVPAEDRHVHELLERREHDEVPQEEPVADRSGPDQGR